MYSTILKVELKQNISNLLDYLWESSLLFLLNSKIFSFDFSGQFKKLSAVICPVNWKSVKFWFFISMVLSYKKI